MSIELGNNLRMVWNWGNFLSEDTRPQIINTSDNTLVCSLEGHTDYVRGAIALEDNRLATWSNDLTVRIWQLDGSCDFILDGHESYAASVHALGDSRLLTCDGKGTLFCWDLQTGAKLWTRPIPDGVDSFAGPNFDCLVGNRLLARFHKGWVLYNLNDGEVVRSVPEYEGGRQACKINEEVALIHNHKQADIIQLSDGSVTGHIPLDGYKTEILNVGSARLLIGHTPFSSSGPTRFKLISVIGSEWSLIGQCSIPTDDILWMKHDVRSDQVTVSLADYRRLEIQLSPMKIASCLGVRGQKSEGFVSFAPSEDFDNQSEPLSVIRLSETDALSSAIDGLQDLSKLGMLSDGRLVAHVSEQWRVYHPDFKDFDTLSPALMEDVYPDYLEEVEWQDILRNGSPKALATRMARQFSLPIEQVVEQIYDLRNGQTDCYVHFAPCYDGSIAAWARGKVHQYLWHMDEGLEFRQIANEDDNMFLLGDFILSPKGVVHRLVDEKCVPFKLGNKRELQFHPDFRNKIRSVRWCQGDRLVFRQGTGVNVISPLTGEEINFLDGGHGMGNWGFVEMDDGKLVTWTRLSLRSWSAKDYTPLVELQDPEDWGPGYEEVSSFGDQIGFFVGQYSGDSRVMMWDGEMALKVYGGHSSEIMGLKRLSPDTFASMAGLHGYDYGTHVWSIPTDASALRRFLFRK